MQTNILERIRVLEAQVEKGRDAITQQRLLPITNERHILLRDRFIAEQTEQLSKNSADLLDLYLDGDDLPAVQEESMPMTKLMSYFSARVANIREYYRTHDKAGGEVTEDPIEPDLEHLMEDGVFAPDEKYGTRLRFQDHYSSFERFRERCAANAADEETRNMVSRVRVPFERFLFEPTAPLSDTPQRLKMLESNRYFGFVNDLRRYLISYHERVRPLQKALLKAQLNQASAALDSYWHEVEAAAANAATSGSSTHFRAAAVSRPYPFLVAPWDLRSIPAQDTAQRLLAKSIAHAEAEVAIMVMGPSGCLSEVAKAAAEGYQADQSKIAAELQREEEEAEEAFLTSLEQMEERWQTAKAKTAPRVAGEDFNLDLLNLGQAQGSSGQTSSGNVLSGDVSNAAFADRVNVVADQGSMPLDADGNPLPMWQIKLEGRRLTFACEVCAGAVYRGPKMWHEHFRGPLHTEGLRRLGILNIPAFDGIHTILGVQLIAAQLKSSAKSNLLKRIEEEWQAMEVEDDAGMVMERRAYEKARKEMGRQ